MSRRAVCIFSAGALFSSVLAFAAFRRNVRHIGCKEAMTIAEGRMVENLAGTGPAYAMCPLQAAIDLRGHEPVSAMEVERRCRTEGCQKWVWVMMPEPDTARACLQIYGRDGLPSTLKLFCWDVMFVRSGSSFALKKVTTAGIE